MPGGNIGPFESNHVHKHTLGSYATEGGLVKVPILNSKGQIVSSTVPSFQEVSANSLLNVYYATHRIKGLPEHVEQVFRGDLGLPKLKSILEHDLGVVSSNCQLNCSSS